MKVVDLNPVLFREYDLRGVVGDIINEDVAYTLGLTYGTYMLNRNVKMVVVGRDTRISSPMIAKALIQGIIETGCNVVDLGVCTTPMFYFARYSLKLYAGIMVTASHNPKEYNGFKISYSEIGNAYGEYIQDLYKFSLKKEFAHGEGKVEHYDIKPSYIDYFVSNIDLKNKNIKVALDLGNGTAGIVARDILDRLHIQYAILYETPDGNFPNHIADPSIEANMEDLKKFVVENHYDIGIGIDGDADRVGIISEKGEYIHADLYILFMARYLKGTLKDNKVLFDVKCSRALIDGLRKAKINECMYRTGNSYLNMKMKLGDFSFGGEYSGHIFYRDKWACFDDGLYAGMRFVEMLDHTGYKISELIASTDKYYSVMHEVYAGENGKREVVKKMIDYAHKNNFETIELDGVRIEFENSWALVRFSNTTPNLTIRLEGKTQKDLDEVENKIYKLALKFIDEVKE